MNCTSFPQNDNFHADAGSRGQGRTFRTEASGDERRVADQVVERNHQPLLGDEERSPAVAEPDRDAAAEEQRCVALSSVRPATRVVSVVSARLPEHKPLESRATTKHSFL